jgi:drug/metabolite transporter (DMT)-like permease
MLAISLALIACLSWGTSGFLAGMKSRVIPVLFYKRPPLKIKAIHLPAVIAIGLLDGTAAFAYTAATTKGMLSLVSVISSLYPVVAIILAAMILKERLGRFQLFGVILTILGITLISAF